MPVTTWIGIGGTALLALLGLASGGLWSMLMMVALVVLVTAVYGVLFRRATWLRLPRKRAAAALSVGIAMVVLVGSTSAYGATHPTVAAPVIASSATAVAAPHPGSKTARPEPPAPTQTPTPTPTPTPVVVTKLVAETSPVPFESTSVPSGSLAKGTSTISTAGVPGVRTKTFSVTYTDGVETGRVLRSDRVTTPPVTQVTTVGTYVAPPPPPAPTCTNGTYVNAAGNTVCRPEVSSSAPSGATAKCVDGTYSFSQSRRGTCSHHGGVSVWL